MTTISLHCARAGQPRKKMGDTPLLETGAMRDGITTEKIDAHTVEVIAKDPKSSWHELGTATIPPRPFLGPAAERTKDEHLMAGLHTGF